MLAITFNNKSERNNCWMPGIFLPTMGEKGFVYLSAFRF
jgi:hypothetical protein